LCGTPLNLYVMKKILFLMLAVLFLVHRSSAQDLFTVIKVSGNIVIQRTGSTLGIGTSFPQDENLVFKAPESRAAVINPQRGRFLLTADNQSEFRSSKSVFLPSAGKISTRTLNLNSKGNLKDELQGSFVILNEMKMIVDTALYPLSDKKYLYISYDFNNRTINKKLSFNKDTLIIKRNELLTIGGNEIVDPKIDHMNLIYLIEGTPYVSKQVCSFNPVFPDSKTISQEIGIIIDKLNNSSYNEKLAEISSFFEDFYGKVDYNSLRNWLDKYLGLRKQ
jgi:hypothetical protein